MTWRKKSEFEQFLLVCFPPIGWIILYFYVLDQATYRCHVCGEDLYQYNDGTRYCKNGHR